MLWRQPAADTRSLIDAVSERNRRRDDWSVTDELLAQVIDVLSVMRIEAWRQAGVKVSDLPKPHRVPRPGEPATQEVVMTPGEFARTMVAG